MSSQNKAKTDDLVSRYLDQVRRATVRLAPAARAELVAQLEDHLRDARAGLDPDDLDGVEALLKGLGTPSEIAAAALGEPDTATTGRSSNQRHARTYRTQRAVITWGLSIAYSIALIVCFIVNLAVNHGLTWFFIVLTAILVAASLTLLPYWVDKNRWLIVVSTFLVTLFLLLFTVWVYTGSGSWLATATAGILFGFVVVFGPLVLHSLEPVGRLARNKALFCVGVDTILLFALVLVALAGSGRQDRFGTLAVPIIAVSLIPVWVSLLVIRYLPTSSWFKATICLTVIGLWEFFFNPVIRNIVDATPLSLWDHFALTQWGTDDLINANVRLLTTLACLAAGSVTAIIGLARRGPETKIIG